MNIHHFHTCEVCRKTPCGPRDRRRKRCYEIRDLQRPGQMHARRHAHTLLLRGVPPHILLQDDTRAGNRPARGIHRQLNQLHGQRHLPRMQRQVNAPATQINAAARHTNAARPIRTGGIFHSPPTHIPTHIQNTQASLR